VHVAIKKHKMIKHSRPIRTKVSQQQIGMFSKLP